jgi:ABC-2 type transport system permease protein
VSANGTGATTAWLALVGAGFRRYATYRQATWSAAFTNTVFGFLNYYVLLAVLGSRPDAAGYGREQLTSYVWLAQGVLGIVLLWGWTDLADRVRTGDVTIELLRPINPIWTYLAGDLGRAGHAALTRLIVPLAVGALLFDLYTPARLFTYPLFVLSVAAAVLVSFSVRYLVNLAAFWLLDIRGLATAWTIAGNMFTGLFVPIHFFPGWAQAALWATPFPAMMQVPLDVIVERGGTGHSALLVAGQLGWAAALLGVAHLVQRRAVRKLVVQGG